MNLLTYLHDAVPSKIDCLDLGSLEKAMSLSPAFKDFFKIYSVDALAPGEGEGIVKITNFIAHDTSKRTFFTRSFAPCSSFLPPHEQQVLDFGLESLFEPVSAKEVDSPTTVDQLSAEYGVNTWGVVKTDLEGLDTAVVKSISNLRSTTLLQMELRPTPFYDGEPRFEEALAYLSAMDFTLVDMQPMYWRYKGPLSRLDHRGTLAYINAVFVNQSMNYNRSLAPFLILLAHGYLTLAEKQLSRVDLPYSEKEQLWQMTIDFTQAESVAPPITSEFPVAVIRPYAVIKP